MTLARARELRGIQAGFCSFHDGIPARPMLFEVTHEHGQAAVDALIVRTRLDRVFRLKPGARFVGGIAHGPPGDGQ